MKFDEKFFDSEIQRILGFNRFDDFDEMLIKDSQDDETNLTKSVD